MRGKVLFLSDGGLGVGWGHVFRLKPVYVEIGYCGLGRTFSVASQCMDSSDIADGLSEFPGEEEAFASWINEASPDVIVVDSYRHHALLRDVKRRSNKAFHILQFDDHYRPIDPDCTIVNAAPDASGQQYRDMGCSEEKLLLGPKFASVAEPFVSMRDKRKELSPTIRKIVVALGGCDTESNLVELLSSLADAVPENAEIKVIGDADVAFKGSRIAMVGWLDQRKLATLMSASDLAIFGGGSMLLQAMTMGLPVLSWPQTRNQKQHAEAWRERGGIILLEALVELSSALDSLEDVNMRQILRNRGGAMIDGKGAGRIASYICTLAKESRHVGRKN